ncbi:MAG TPA: hypothetical protein VK612_12770 [Pyrinomonadaceae bacterium]|nr:hypothetical protein [Pyrinomonadaceae bacterium]
MPNYRRLFVSTSLIALLLFTTLFPSKAEKAYACPVEVPYTLLQLYLDSDLALTADITSEELVNREEGGSDEGAWVDMRKNIRIVDIYKGVPPKNLSFVRSEYFSRVKNEDGNEEQSYGVKVGSRYLLFFNKDEDTGEFDLLGSSSAVKELDAAKQALYNKRILELSSIVKARKNQLPKLTEWLVKLTEEAQTLYDGVTDISRSFYRVNDAVEEEETDESEESTEMTSFSLEEYGRAIFNPDIAKALTESHKKRLSTVLEGQLQDSLAKAVRSDESTIDYDLVKVVRNWDRNDLTMRANGMIQGSDPNDSKRISVLMMLITFAVDDGKLDSTYYEYRDIANADVEEEMTESPAEVKVDETQPVLAEPNPDPQPPLNETAAGVAVLESKVESSEQKDGTSASLEEVPTLAEIRARIIQQFTERFQYLLANGFPDEAGTETETIYEPHGDPIPAEVPVLTTK